jgi:hypothetical protein
MTSHQTVVRSFRIVLSPCGPNRWGSAEVSLNYCHCHSSPTRPWAKLVRKARTLRQTPVALMHYPPLNKRERPAASQGGLICSDRKLGRPPTEVVRWLVPVAAVIGASWGRVVVVLSEIAALGEARSRDQRDKRESSDKCLHDTSPWFRTVVLQRGKPIPFAAAAWSRCTQENMCEIAPDNLEVPRRTFWDIRTIGNRIGQSELSN